MKALIDDKDCTSKHGISKARLNEELQAMRQRLLVEERQRKTVEYELVKLKKVVPEKENVFEVICFYTLRKNDLLW